MRFVFTALKKFISPLVVMRSYWSGARHPIFRAELKRAFPRPALGLGYVQVPSITAIRRLWRRARFRRSVPPALLAVIFAIALIVLFPFFLPVLMIGFLFVPLVLALVVVFIPFVPWLWRIPTLLMTSVSVAREIENRRWSALRTTLYSTQEIVQALHAAGTYRVRSIWFYVTALRMILGGFISTPLLFVLIGSLISIVKASVVWLSGGEARVDLMLLDWSAYLLSILYLVIEPFLDLAVDGMIGVLAATFSRTQLNAMLNGVLLRVVLWAVQVLSLLFLMPLANQLLTPTQAGNVPVLMLLGPAYGLLAGFSPVSVIVMLVGVAVLRVLGLHLLSWMAVRRAGMIAA